MTEKRFQFELAVKIPISKINKKTHTFDDHGGINGVYFGSPMFADDSDMLSRMKSGLERMLECTWEYSIK